MYDALRNKTAEKIKKTNTNTIFEPTDYSWEILL